MTVKHVSPSSWNLWEQCKLAWGARYVMNEPDPGTVYTVRGQAFHEGADLLYSHPPEMRGAKLTEACRDAMVDSYAAPHREVGGTTDELATFMERWFLGLTAIEYPLNVDVVSTEEEFVGVELNGVPVKGYVDRVQRAVHGPRNEPVLKVVDYKTGKRKPARRQMVMYAAAVELAYGEKCPTAELYYVNEGKPEPVLTGPTAQKSVLGQLAEVWDEMREAELTGNFPAKPGPLCEWRSADGRTGQCFYLSKCKAGQRYVREHGGRRR